MLVFELSIPTCTCFPLENFFGLVESSLFVLGYFVGTPNYALTVPEIYEIQQVSVQS